MNITELIAAMKDKHPKNVPFNATSPKPPFDGRYYNQYEQIVDLKDMFEAEADITAETLLAAMKLNPPKEYPFNATSPKPGFIGNYYAKDESIVDIADFFEAAPEAPEENPVG